MINQNVTQIALRPEQAAKYLGISRTKLYELVDSDPSFPKRIYLGPRCVVFHRSELDAWFASKLGSPNGFSIRRA